MSYRYQGEILIKKLELGRFGTNGYIVICPQTHESIIIDTPDEADRILAEAEGTVIKHIIITHTHGDHLGAFREVRSRSGAPVAVHPLEAERLPSPPNYTINEGDTVKFGTVSLQVLHTPGHTPGSICLLTGKHLFSGDTIFPAGPGHTSRPADLQQIIKSITEKIFVLPDDTLVYPGHGLDTVLGKEKQEYAVFAGRPHNPNLCGDVLWLSS